MWLGAGVARAGRSAAAAADVLDARCSSRCFAFALFAASLHLLMGSGRHGLVRPRGDVRPRRLRRRAAPASWAGCPCPLAFVLAPGGGRARPPACIGYFCVRLSSIYFAMLTLAFAQIVYAIVHQWYDVTGGDNGMLGVWPARVAGHAEPLLLLGARRVRAAASPLLRRSSAAPFGLTLRAVRDHARRAEAVGRERPRATSGWRSWWPASSAGSAAPPTCSSRAACSRTTPTSPMSVRAAGDGAAGRRRRARRARRSAPRSTSCSTPWSRATRSTGRSCSARFCCVLVLAFPRGIAGCSRAALVSVV